VLNRYVPPDFDPSIIPRFKRDKNRVMEVRMMLPFSMRCTTCGEYMGRGKKFNSRKEDCKGEDYMGIRRFRFIVKCSVCSAEISFKTDPKNSDYECEYGATRNYEMWAENAALLTEEERVRVEEEETDAMKSLENRTLDSKIEMDVLDALDEIKAINQRHERVDTAALLEARAQAAAQRLVKASGLTEDEENLVKSVQFASKANKRLDDSDSDSEVHSDTTAAAATATAVDLRAAVASKLAAAETAKKGTVVTVIKKKRKVPSGATASVPSKSIVGDRDSAVGSGTNGESNGSSSSVGGDGSSSSKRARADVPPAPAAPTAAGGGGLGALLGDYGDSSGEDN
jgi:hypothetical protein